MTSEFGRAKQFFRSYFHQDWLCEGSGFQDVVALFTSENSLEVAKNVALDLTAILARPGFDERAANEFLEVAGCEIGYAHHGFSSREWIVRICDLLRPG